jgi:ubiquinone/menaquinone biosynthesis C-methylase UbiE
MLPVAGVLQVLKPKPGQRFLDVGCGEGALFFPVFEAMQGQGVFLAAELQEDRLRSFLNRLEAYAEHPGYAHIEVVRAKPDRLPLPDACADMVLLAGVLAELGDRVAYLRELKRLLAPGGTLCLVDQRPVDEALACDELQQAGFGWIVSHAGFDDHWCLSARR